MSGVHWHRCPECEQERRCEAACAVEGAFCDRPVAWKRYGYTTPCTACAEGGGRDEGAGYVQPTPEHVALAGGCDYGDGGFCGICEPCGRAEQIRDAMAAAEARGAARERERCLSCCKARIEHNGRGASDTRFPQDVRFAAHARADEGAILARSIREGTEPAAGCLCDGCAALRARGGEGGGA